MNAKEIRFTLNDRPLRARVDAHRNLVELLHELGLYGARESCGQGLCGCCTVLVNGVAVSGCLYLAIAADGKNITTVEHLDAGGTLSHVQQAFIESGAFQCGNPSTIDDYRGGKSQCWKNQSLQFPHRAQTKSRQLSRCDYRKQVRPMDDLIRSAAGSLN